MILLKSTDILRFHLAGAVATNELDFVTAWADITGFVQNNNSGTSNGATDVTIVSAPGASVIRQVKFISITNRDSANADVTVEFYNGTARNLLTWTLSPLDVLTFLDHEGWKVLDQYGNTKVTVGTGGAGSITSAEYLSLVNRVSANSAQMTSADNAISNAVSIVSVAAADALSKANAVSNAVSVLSTVVSNAVSAIQANSADVTSLKDRVSANSALLSNAISAIQANSAQMTSANNAISNAVSVVSVAVTLKNDKITIQNQGSNTVSNPATINFYGNAVSTILSVGVTKVQISTTAGAGSITSAEYLSLVDRVSANSAQMTSADNAISAVAADALSKANTVSNAVSVLSVVVSNTVSAVQANSADVTSLKNRVSAISTTVTNNSAQMTSADNAISAVAADALSKANTVSNAVSVLSVVVSNTVSAVQANSADVTSLKNRVSANSAQMVSADNAISNAVSIVSVAVTTKNTIITVIDEGTSVLSNPAFLEFTGAGVSVSVSGTKAVIIIPGGAGGGSVTSADFVSLRGLVQSNSAQMTSADNAISAAVVVVSALVSTVASALSVRINTVSNAVSALSLDSLTNVSLATPPNDGDVLMYNASANEWHSSAAPGGTASVTSAEHLSLVDRVSANSTQMVSADNAISAVAADALSKANAVSNAVSVLSVVVSNTVSAVQANSADVTSLKNRVSAISADLTSFKQSINNFGDVSAVPSDQQVLTWSSAAGAWVASTITAGVGSVTSAEVSAVSAAAASADATLSVRIDSVASLASNAISAIQANSAQMTSADNALSVRIGGILDTEIRIVSNTQSTNGSALVDVSGMVLTVGANETWEFYGVLLVSTSATTVGLRAGLSVTPLSTPRYIKFVGGSAAQSATVAGGGGQLQVSGNSIMLSLTGIGAAGAAIPINFNGLFNTTSAGTIRLMTCGIASTAASPLHIMPGTYMVCKRLV